MPAWMTSLFRELVAVPMASAASRTMTSRPAIAIARATANPTTPAPITMQSVVSVTVSAIPFLSIHQTVLRDASVRFTSVVLSDDSDQPLLLYCHTLPSGTIAVDHS